MELHMGAHHWEQRLPDWQVAAVAGFCAGAAVMVVELLWSTLAGDGNPWAASHKIAAITMGRDALQSSGGFELGIVSAALVTHYVLGIIFGIILAAIMAPFRLDSSPGMALAIGAAFGLALYLVNFYLVARVLPWFADMRGWETTIAHLVFGMTAAIIYWKLERPKYRS